MFRDSAHAFCQQELQPTILKVMKRVLGCKLKPLEETLNQWHYLLPNPLTQPLSTLNSKPQPQANRNEHFDAGLMKKMGEQGLLGATVQGYGCAGVNYVT